MEIRKSARNNTRCRGCEQTLKKGEWVLHHYSSANQGTTIFFCLECVDSITKLKEKHCEQYPVG